MRNYLVNYRLEFTKIQTWVGSLKFEQNQPTEKHHLLRMNLNYIL